MNDISLKEADDLNISTIAVPDEAVFSDEVLTEIIDILIQRAVESFESTEDYQFREACQFVDIMFNKFEQMITLLNAVKLKVTRCENDHQQYKTQYADALEHKIKKKIDPIIQRHARLVSMSKNLDRMIADLTVEQSKLVNEYILHSAPERILNEEVLQAKITTAKELHKRDSAESSSSNTALQETQKWIENSSRHDATVSKPPLLAITVPEVEPQAEINVVVPNKPDQAAWHARRTEERKRRTEQRQRELENSIAPVMLELLKGFQVETSLSIPVENTVSEKNCLLFDMIRYLEIIMAIAEMHNKKSVLGFIREFRNHLVHPEISHKRETIMLYAQAIYTSQIDKVQVLNSPNNTTSCYGVSGKAAGPLVSALRDCIKTFTFKNDSMFENKLVGIFTMFYELCAELDILRTMPHTFPRVLVMWVAKLVALRQQIKHTIGDDEFGKLCQYIPLIRTESMEPALEQRNYSMHFSTKEKVGAGALSKPSQPAYYSSVRLDITEENIAAALAFVRAVDTRVLRVGMRRYCTLNAITFEQALNPSADEFVFRQ